jgi:cytosine/adenosine deaminase-related metal-dependent hydrolase|tara:strand:- start:2845 stop:4170 length:1326 start_codon:yes stop_codon:yes gene_type:complete
MKTAIKNGKIVSYNNEISVQENQSLIIENNIIADIVENSQVEKKYPDAKIIDATNKAILSGFANCHTHFRLTLARGIFENESPSNTPPFPGLPRRPLPKISKEEHQIMVLLGAIESIKAGTTAAMEVAEGITDYADELQKSGLRLVLAEQISDRISGSYGEPGEIKSDPQKNESGLEQMSNLYSKWHNYDNSRITVGIAAWAPDMNSPNSLQTIRALQDKLNVVSTIHLNQLWGEVQNIKDNYGTTPTKYLEQNNFLNDKLVAAHCRCMSTEEEKILGEYNSTVSFNAAIAARRGLSPNIKDLERFGCKIAMGSDNMDENMIVVMRTGMFMERVRMTDGRNPSPNEAYTWATHNGYKSLGISDAGTLTKGSKADLIIINLLQPHLTPQTDIVSNWVHMGQNHDVESVMVDGKWIMKEHKILNLDEEYIITKANEIAARVWK